jgi:hypothetical protein
MDILEILKKKLSLFREYELETLKLIDDTPENSTQYIEKRDELTSQIDALTPEYLELIKSNPSLAKPLSTQTDRSTLSPTEQEIFDINLQTIACVNRIAEHNKLAFEKITSEMDSIKHDIKKQNTSQSAAANKYSRVLSQSPSHKPFKSI